MSNVHHVHLIAKPAQMLSPVRHAPMRDNQRIQLMALLCVASAYRVTMQMAHLVPNAHLNAKLANPSQYA